MCFCLLSKNVKNRIHETIIFACGFVWLWNLVSDIKGGTQTGRVWEQGAEEDILTEEG
jgi:hypothetical protein